MTGKIGIDGSKIDPSPLATTRRACKMMEGNISEGEFTKALEGADQFTIAENVLAITDENGVETLKFRRMSEDLFGLANVRWELAKIENAPDGKIPEKAYLEINSKENRLGGNSGCNGFGGNFEVSGDSIHFSGIISTMMACEKFERNGSCVPEGRGRNRPF